jgi:hypothetical protein
MDVACTVVCTLVQVAFVALLAVLFFVGLVSVIGALEDLYSSPQKITKRTRTEIEEITSDSQRAMDELSEHYLNRVYDQVTHHRRR